MTGRLFDTAVFGSGAASALLAALLAERHGKRVVLVAEKSAPARLARGFDISAAPVTRPETWALVTEGTSETLAVLRQHAGEAMERVDPLFVAQGGPETAALGHMRHVAEGFGHEFEPVPEVPGAPNRLALRLRDAVRLNGRRALPALLDWLAGLGCRIDAQHACEVTLKRDGKAVIEVGGDRLEAESAILADDAAILAYCATDELEKRFTVHHATSVLAEPGALLPAPVIFGLDDGIIVSQGASGAIACVGTGDPADVTKALGRQLPRGSSTRLAGRTSFLVPRTADGGPVAGPLGRRRTFVAAGLGPPGVFLMPALARFLAGEASDAESDYFSARAPGKPPARSSVAEFATGQSSEQLT